MGLLEDIARGETVGLEFKEARPRESLKFTKTVVAFANGRGGRILFGVENETGRIVGVPTNKVAAEMDAIVDVIANTCVPAVSVDVRPATVNGRCLIALDVRPGDRTPYYVRAFGMRKGTFLRIGATTRQAEEYALKGLILSGENLSFDGQSIGKTALTGTEIDEACRLMTETARRNCRDAAEKKALKPMNEKRLASLGIIVRCGRRYLPTYAFRIVTGGTVSDILPPCIKCGCFRGVTKGDFIDRRTCEGPLVDQIDEAFNFVIRNIRVGSEIVGTARRDVYELPLGAVREALCNAAFHRDYLVPSCIYVALYDDRLEILSPGGLVRDMTIEDAVSGFSKIRNFKIAAALEYMKEVEGGGGGVMRYFSACSELGLPAPTVGENAGMFKVVFPRHRSLSGMIPPTGLGSGGTARDNVRDRVNDRVSDRVSDRVNDSVNDRVSDGVLGVDAREGSLGALFSAIQANQGQRVGSLASLLGKSTATVMRYIRVLRDRGLIEFRGAPKTGGYYVTGQSRGLEMRNVK